MHDVKRKKNNDRIPEIGDVRVLDTSTSAQTNRRDKIEEERGKDRSPTGMPGDGQINAKERTCTTLESG